MSAPQLPVLDPASCQLLNPALVKRYNDLAALLQDAMTLPRLAPQAEQFLLGEPPRKDETEEDADRRQAQTLTWVAERLVRSHFQIGFLGRNQIGKSSALNNILDIDKSRAPSEQGNFEATTSVITRIRFRAEGEDALTLSYLDEAGYRHKRDALCAALGLSLELDDQVLLNQELPKRILAMRRGEVSVALAEDPAYLAKLIRSYLQFRGEYLGRTIRPTAGYAERARHLNHNHINPSPSAVMLLREAVIDFQSTLIDPRLELIDLPGLGAQISVDSLLSRTFMKNLDGALVFQSLKNLASADTEKVFNHLRMLYGGRYENRVWFVITMFDDLQPVHLEGSSTQESVIDKIVRLASRNGVPESQVCLVSNTLAQKVRRARLEGRELPLEQRAEHILAGGDGNLPPAVTRFPSLVEAYKALLEDGGIGRLRSLFKNSLAPLLTQQMERDVADKLTSTCKKFRTAVEFSRKSSAGDLLPHVNRCLETVVYPRLSEMATRTTLFDELVVVLRERLQAFFKENLFSDAVWLNDMGLDYLEPRFPGHCAQLRDQLDMLLQDPQEMHFYQFYAMVGQSLPTTPEIPVAGQPSVRAAWDYFTSQDSLLEKWFWISPYAPIFAMPEFFPALREAGVETFGGEAYRAMMREKILRSAHQSCHLLRRQLWVRLDELRVELENLTHIRPDEKSGLVSARAYDELLSRMTSLCP